MKKNPDKFRKSGLFFGFPEMGSDSINSPGKCDIAMD